MRTQTCGQRMAKMALVVALGLSMTGLMGCAQPRGSQGTTNLSEDVGGDLNQNSNGSNEGPSSSNLNGVANENGNGNENVAKQDSSDEPASSDSNEGHRSEDADYSAQKTEFAKRLEKCEHDEEHDSRLSGTMAEVADAGSDACDAYKQLMDDVVAFLDGTVLSDEEAQSLKASQEQWKSTTEANAAQASKSQGPRSGYAMALDYYGVYLNAYPSRIQELIDRISGKVDTSQLEPVGDSSDASQEGDSAASENAPKPVQASDPLPDGWYRASMNKDPTAVFPLFYIEPDGAYWNITGCPHRSDAEDELWSDGVPRITEDVETWHMPVAYDVELYRIDARYEPYKRTDLSREDFEAALKPEVIQQMFVFHVEGGQVVSAHFTCVPGV